MDYRKRKGQRSRFCYFSFSILEKGGGGEESQRPEGKAKDTETGRQKRKKERERQRDGETQWNRKLGREKKLHPKYMDIQSTVGGGFQSLNHVLCL